MARHTALILIIADHADINESKSVDFHAVGKFEPRQDFIESIHYRVVVFFDIPKSLLLLFGKRSHIGPSAAFTIAITITLECFHAGF